MYDLSSPLTRWGITEKRERSVKHVKQIFCLVTLTVAGGGLYCLYSTELSGQPLVQLLNNRSLSWTAGMNNISGRRACWSGEVLKARRSSGREASLFRLPSISPVEDPHIPTTYDFRERHPSCQNLTEVEYHPGCPTSWVEIVASVASDRLCVASGASVRARLWAQDVLTCCTLCQGPLHAWLYLNARGFLENHQVSQGEAVSCSGALLSERVGGKHANHSQPHRHYGTSAFLLAQSVERIQLEMMRNGPVVSILDVYSDFYYYSSGVYQHKYGSYQGSMAVKLIGWGQESGLDYWLAVTSAGDLWGDHGVFKIRRGSNECRVEGDVTAGHMLPRYVRYQGTMTVKR